jgi:hypothetical protein
MRKSRSLLENGAVFAELESRGPERERSNGGEQPGNGKALRFALYLN